MKGWPVSLENLPVTLKAEGTRYNFFSIQTWTNMYVYNSYMLYISILNHCDCRVGRWSQGSHCQNERPQAGRV